MAGSRRVLVCLLTVLIVSGCAETPRQISWSGSGAYEASLQRTDDGFVVVWHDYRDGNAEIYARVLEEQGRPQGPERRLTHSPALSFEGHLDIMGDDVVVAWYDRPRTGPLEARVGLWSQEKVRPAGNGPFPHAIGAD